MKLKPVPVAGVDVSKEFSDMCILTPDNAVFERVKIYHDKASMTQSVKALARPLGSGLWSSWSLRPITTAPFSSS